MNAPLHKDWEAICRIEDRLFRQLVAFTRNPDILAGLQRGFPHLFTSTSVPPRVSCELIESWYGDSEEGGSDASLSWIEACEDIGIPIAYHWTSKRDAPQEVIDQVLAFLGGGHWSHSFWTGSLLTVAGRRFLSVTDGVDVYPKHPDARDWRKRKEKRFDIRDLAVVAEDFIDCSKCHEHPRLPHPWEPLLGDGFMRRAFRRVLDR